jgi:hypothetical protein
MEMQMKSNVAWCRNLRRFCGEKPHRASPVSRFASVVFTIAACSSNGSQRSPDASPDSSAAIDAWGSLDQPILIDGTANGVAANTPADWPTQAGPWNAKGASYCAAHDRLVFETTRADIVGGSTSSTQIQAAGIAVYYTAGPSTGTLAAGGTSVLYIANGDGSSPTCVGCVDVVDGQGGAQIYKVAPSTTAQPASIVRQTGATIYANRNKDLGHWTADCAWLVAGVEMPRHAETHGIGTSEIGMFNDLWAISSDGKLWVQLTDYAATWPHADAIAPMPFQCTDAHCPTGCQYGSGAPFGAYSCRAPGPPPPASGTMRPIVSNATTGATVMWSERVGVTLDPNQPRYAWGGVLQLASAELVMVGGLPALASYRRNLTPTPEHPAGIDLWNGTAIIGAGYESWAFSDDDATFLFAGDAFRSTSNPAIVQPVSKSSQAFTDAIAWQWNAPSPSLVDVTAYDPVVYAYQPNAAPAPVSSYGHWEEPIVPSRGTAAPFYAFASSADLTPTWDPASTMGTFGLEVWLVRVDRGKPATKLTHFNEPATAGRTIAYPTALDPTDQSLYITAAPVSPGSNPPGALYRLRPTPP